LSSTSVISKAITTYSQIYPTIPTTARIPLHHAQTIPITLCYTL
jgi:hypothetical protein